MIDTAQVYTVTANDTYVLTEEIENCLNDCIDDSVSNNEREISLTENYNGNLSQQNSVKFSGRSDSIIFGDHDYEDDQSRTVSNKEALSAGLDTIKSGESLIKYYYFDESKYSSDTNKCIAFWKTITENELKPVECEFKVNNLETVSDEGDEVESSHDKTKEFIWYNALLEMKKRKMDQLALAAIGPSCRLCDPDGKPRKGFNKDELKDNEDLLGLNSWDPEANKKLKYLDRKPINRGDSSDLEDDGDICSCYKEECVCPPVKEEEPVQTIPQNIKLTCMPALVKHLVKGKSERSVVFQRKSVPPAAPPKAPDINAFKTICGFCKNLFCTCKDHFEEADAVFVKELRCELQYVRKDKSCSTEDQELISIPFTIPAGPVEKKQVTNNSVHQEIAAKGKGLNIKTFYESLSDSCSRDSTVLSLGKIHKRSTVYSGLSGSSPTLKEIPTISRTCATAATRTYFDNTSATTIDTFISDDNVKEKMTETNQQPQMLWYSSKIPNHL